MLHGVPRAFTCTILTAHLEVSFAGWTWVAVVPVEAISTAAVSIAGGQIPRPNTFTLTCPVLPCAAAGSMIGAVGAEAIAVNAEPRWETETRIVHVGEVAVLAVARAVFRGA